MIAAGCGGGEVLFAESLSGESCCSVAVGVSILASPALPGTSSDSRCLNLPPELRGLLLVGEVLIGNRVTSEDTWRP